MKKPLLLLISILLIAALLAACSPGTPGTGTPSSNATSTPKPSPTQVLPTTTQLPRINVDPASLKGLQILFMHPWSGALSIEMAKLIDEFNQSNDWGIHVIAVTPGSAGSLAGQLNDDIATGNQPDLVAAPIDILLKVDTSASAFADLNPYLYSSQWGLTAAELADFNPAYLEQDNVAGFQYGFPAQRTAALMFYNATWAKELGFSNAPATPDDFKNQVCAANQALKKDAVSENDGLGGWIVNTDGLVMDSWLSNFGADIYANGSYSFSSPPAQAAFEYLHGLLTAECAWIPRLSDPYAYFASRQALVYSGYMQDILPQLTANSLATDKDAWTVIPFPSSQSQKIEVEGPSYAVLNTTPDKQLAAWLFVRWLSSAEHQARVVQASMTLPLSASVEDQLLKSGAVSQQWKDAVSLASRAVTVPSDPNWSIAKMILEDAGWQLFKTNIATSDIPALLTQMDTTFTELKDRQP